MSAYLTDIARTHAPSTVTKLSKNLALFFRFIKQTNRTMAWATLSRQTLADYYAWLSLPENGLWGHPRAASTIKRLVEVVQTAWEWFANHDDYLPLAGPARFLPMTAPMDREVVAPTWLEMSMAIAASSGWYKQLTTLLYGTGLRVGQAIRLRFDDVDFQRATLRIRPELGKTRSERRGRTVPLAPWLLEEIAGWGTRDGWLIKGSAKTRIPRGHIMRAVWLSIGVNPDVWKGRPFHGFRKGFRSGLSREGADDKAAKALIGHSLGLDGVYLDPNSIPMRAAVALIPRPSISNVVRMQLAGGEA